jgi:hypothetical protein
MRPGSPDRALEQAFSESESALARIGHVNRLSRDIMDIKYYEADLGGTNSTTIKISSKKGIVDLVNFDDTADTIFIALRNPEITPDREKFYIQLTAYTTGTATPIIIGIGTAPDVFNLKIKDVDAAQDWGDLYFYYDLVKID